MFTAAIFFFFEWSQQQKFKLCCYVSHDRVDHFCHHVYHCSFPYVLLLNIHWVLWGSYARTWCKNLRVKIFIIDVFMALIKCLKNGSNLSFFFLLDTLEAHFITRGKILLTLWTFHAWTIWNRGPYFINAKFRNPW